MYKKNSHINTTLCLIALGLISAGCSTGIEGTKTITMSGSEKRSILPSAEEEYIASLVATPLSEWKSGREFIITDNKAALIFDAAYSDVAYSDSLHDKVISFDRIESRLKPDGSTEASIIYKWNSKRLVYPTNRSVTAAGESLTGLDVPMLIDLQLVAKCDSMLRGKQLWTRTGLWYDEDYSQVDGRQFAEVRIDSVTAGNTVFPFLIHFTDTAGHHAHVPMSLHNEKSLISDNRSFASLFSLTNPRLKYSSVPEEHWELICAGKVAAGMTKDECRLALGNPADVDTGHDWNSTMDIWRYTDGRCLMFQDGLLVRIINGGS